MSELFIILSIVACISALNSDVDIPFAFAPAFKIACILC